MYMIVEVSQYVAVASFLEVWIEICTLFPITVVIICRLLLGGVD